MGHLVTKEFNASDIPDLFPELRKNAKALQWCAFNEAAGPGFIGLIDGKPVGFGGLRVSGLAEAYLYVTPGLSGDGLGRRITALRGMLEHLEHLQEERGIWKVWAESIKDDGISAASQLGKEDLLRFAGFKKNLNAFTKTVKEV